MLSNGSSSVLMLLQAIVSGFCSFIDTTCFDTFGGFTMAKTNKNMTFPMALAENSTFSQTEALPSWLFQSSDP